MDYKVDVVELVKYVVGLISFIAVLNYKVNAMKKSLNGLGGKMRRIELGQARIEGHLGMHPLPENQTPNEPITKDKK